jgi:hypothetical protein
MSIDFNPDRFEKIKETYKLWWDKKLERPIIPIILHGKSTDITKPKTPLLSQSTCAELSTPVKDIISRIDYELSQNIYLGDAFPHINLNCFGPGVVAAFLGARLDNSSGRVWFHNDKSVPITELHFEYNPNNAWLNRIKDICNEAMHHFKGQVMVSMPDLGGVMDILSTFRPSEELLYDLYDYPEEIIRLVGEIQTLWHRFYDEINDVLQPINPGFTDWSCIYSDKPSYVLQSDFSYMISPEMFDEFVKPELKATCKKLGNSIYHLDGVGQLVHLDSLLEIEELGAIQWIPGDGKPDQSNWPLVFKKIKNAGKNIQLMDGLHCVDIVREQIGTTKGLLHCPIHAPISEKDAYIRQLSKYGIFND